MNLRRIGLFLMKDLLRDAKHPWTPLALAALPLMLTLLMASIFAPNQDGEPRFPTLNIALLNLDEGYLGEFLLSGLGSTEARESINIHPVDNLDEGIARLEDRQASALIVLPPALTDAMLGGATATIQVYENPAERYLPRTVTQGTSLLAVSAASAAELIGVPLRNFDRMVEQEDFPPTALIGELAEQWADRLRHFDDYLFPPLVQYERIPASAFVPNVSREARGS